MRFNGKIILWSLSSFAVLSLSLLITRPFDFGAGSWKSALSVIVSPAGQSAAGRMDFIGPEIPALPEIVRTEASFPSQSTLQDLLLDFEFSPQQIHQLIEQTRSVYNLNRVRAGNRFVFERFADGRFRRFEYDISDEEFMVVEPVDEGFRAWRTQRLFDTRVERVFATVTSSVWEAVLSQGETGDLVMKLHEILQWDVDFTSIHPHDSFRMLFEKKYVGNQFVKYGDLQSVEFKSGGKTFYGFLFPDPETGEKRYYNDEGKAVRKAFLKVPFNFNPRISSGFSHSRFHPVLKVRRPHYGVDYAAPTGTPVLASGSGTVIFAGTSGGNGRMVRIRHSNGYVSSYLHLSSITVRSGQRVAQGDRIGRVGSTGLATGPHLDYRIQDEKGRYFNPQKVTALPSDKPVDPRYWEDFIAVRDAFKRQLESIPEPEPDTPRLNVAGG